MKVLILASFLQILVILDCFSGSIELNGDVYGYNLVENYDYKVRRKFKPYEKREGFDSRKKRVLYENYDPFLKLNIENQLRAKEPFEDPDNEGLINRKAVLEFNFRAGEDLSVFIQSNVADINYDSSEARGGRLDIEMLRNLDKVGVGLNYNF